jgi:superoxide dismutase, Fe-Mn family
MVRLKSGATCPLIQRSAMSRLSRRQVLAGAAAASAALTLTRDALAGEKAKAAPVAAKPGALTLPPLPWAPDALAPVISANTLAFHYGKHHQAYVDKANELLAGTELAGKPLEEIIKAAAADTAKTGLFNSAAQVWNHTFYWNSLKPGAGGAPTGALLERVKRDLGSVDELKRQLVEAAVTQFGSGWAWLVAEGDKLQVVKTANAETPLTKGQRALLTIDVWEHAYYLDYQSRRKDYVLAVVDKLLDWGFAAKNLK